MYTRNNYIRDISPFIGKPVVKVIAGMRRSGKSCLVRLLIEKLRHSGVPDKQIVYVDKDNYPKFLLTLDQTMGTDHKGMQRLYLPDWLLSDNSTG